MAVTPVAYSFRLTLYNLFGIIYRAMRHCLCDFDHACFPPKISRKIYQRVKIGTGVPFEQETTAISRAAKAVSRPDSPFSRPSFDQCFGIAMG
jgi:hypothetical protein